MPSVKTAPKNIRAVGSHTRDTSVDTATTLAAAANANGFVLQPLTQNIRFTIDGTTPTTAVGFQVAAGDILVWEGWDTDSNTLTVISETSGAEVQIQWINAE